MLLEIDTHSGLPIFRQVLDQIRRQIMAGQMAAGSQLPSVRDLAVQLKVNPMTVSKVYGLLEMEGLAERRRGVGLFVSLGEGRKQEAFKTELLDELLRKAAALAVQFSIPEEEAVRLYQKIHRTLNSNQRRIK
jgi:GntR family transcriptional regulator